MDPTLLANLLIALTANGIPLILKLKADIEAGKTATSVTNEDLLEMARLNTLTAAQIYAKTGTPMPPPA